MQNKFIYETLLGKVLNSLENALSTLNRTIDFRVSRMFLFPVAQLRQNYLSLELIYRRNSDEIFFI